MLLHIPKVLERERLRIMRQMLAQGRFEDGRGSAGKAAQRIKSNEELQVQGEERDTLNRIFVTSLAGNALFRSAALPHRVSDPIFVRYSARMGYGDHIDDPVMGSRVRYRSDIALTLFLSEPESYEGGELVVETTFGAREVKLPAGHAVIYPASSIHRVAEVRAGERLVAVAWIQSLVRDPGRREVLFELDRAREQLLAERPDAEATSRVDHAYVNLVRMWGEL
jgi:PKHD-type hydroxylase